MASNKPNRLIKIASEFNLGIHTIVDFLQSKGIQISTNPNTKVPPEHYNLIMKEFSSEIKVKKESEKIDLRTSYQKESVEIESQTDSDDEEQQTEIHIKDVTARKQKNQEEKSPVEKQREKTFKIVGKIDLDKKEKTEAPEKKLVKQEPTKKEETSKEREKTTVENKKVEKEVKKEVASKKKVVKKKETDKKSNPEQTDKNDSDIKVIGKIDLDSLNQRTRPPKKTRKQKDEERKNREKSKVKQKTEQPQNQKEKNEEESQQVTHNEDGKQVEIFQTKRQKLTGPTVVGKIELPKNTEKKEGDKNDRNKNKKRRKRKRITKEPVSSNNQNKNQQRNKPNTNNNRTGQNKTADNRETNKRRRNTRQRPPEKKEVNEEDVQRQIKETLARLTKNKKKTSVRYRKEKRDEVHRRMKEEDAAREKEKSVIKATEYATVSELASMMNVPVNNLISTCMNVGLFVSINQRLDQDSIQLLADEFGYTVEFTTEEIEDLIPVDIEDTEEDLLPRAPIVTVMGHVDHGKTKLLDYIRSANVIAGEAGGITQHIGAYHVTIKTGEEITFLDTPGHEAFTAMRARGAQLTDVAIIVIAADDSVMPQTIEAINHAQAANVPIVFAINKIDKPAANPDKIKEALSQMNILVEEWGGKYQSQEISAITGEGIDELLEKVLLESEMLALKANPNKMAKGSVVESALDKGRGYVATVLVQEGTLNIGDIVLAGAYTGRIKAMYNEREKRIKTAEPTVPALILGLNGAPQAGDKFYVLENEREAKSIANQIEQKQREQELRAQKHITLAEIGRRIAVGNFQELNIIVKGDVDGSIEALSDSLIKLSTEQIQVNIIHKAVGQISESDVMLAAASNAIIIGFQVRPSVSARKIAEREQIDIRLYSIIYDAINELKDAMAGMLEPVMKEEITATLEIRETFKITKVGTIAGCMVKEGKIKRTENVRLIRDGIVIYTGVLGSLKRFKDDVKEVAKGFECGLNIDKFNDIKVGDVVESFTEVES